MYYRKNPEYKTINLRKKKRTKQIMPNKAVNPNLNKQVYIQNYKPKTN